MGRTWPIWAAVAAAAVVLFVATALFIGPAPPRTVKIAGGAEGGAYAQAAQTLANALEEVGVRAEVVRTAGSAENLERLLAEDDRAVDIALVQSGLADPSLGTDIQTLGALFVEPIWIFARRLEPGPDVQGLAGLTVAVGAPGSGVYAVLDHLTAENRMADNALRRARLSGQTAVTALQQNEVDAAVVVAGVNAQWVQDLLATPGLQLVTFERAPAYERRAPYLAAVTLRRGVLDPGADLPARDIPMLAATAQLAVRGDLHPAIQSVLLQAAKERFSSGDALSAPGEFPNRHAVDLPVSEEAVRFYERGPSALRRYMPYWAANIIERAWMIILPALVLISPLIRSAPPVYRWRTRRKIYLWYRDLRTLEARGRAAESEEARNAVRAALDRLQVEAGRIAVPEAYTDELYRLREHILFVEGLIARRGPRASESAPS